MRIKYSKQATKAIKKLPQDVAKLVKSAIEGLTETPPKGDIKTMQGYSDGIKRLRWIIDVGSRGDIYK